MCGVESDMTGVTIVNAARPRQAVSPYVNTSGRHRVSASVHQTPTVSPSGNREWLESAVGVTRHALARHPHRLNNTQFS